MALNDIEHSIITHMARTMFVTAWSHHQEQVLGNRLRGDAMLLAPATPDYVLREAYFQAGRLAQANPGINGCPSLFFLFRLALKADGRNVDTAQADKALQESFGYGMIMPMMGEGAHWFDSHAEFPLVLPEFEWSHLDLEDGL